MNRLLKFGAALVAGIVAFVACNKDGPNPPQDPSVVALYQCNNDKTNTSPYICFDSLFSDSRCPANAVCFWAGVAVIKVSFHENGNTHVFKMSTPLARFMDAVEDTTINGYRVQFVALNPYPGTSSGPISNKDIKATIHITR